MARDHKDGVKVVLIETRYVETDEKSFKSVVQSLSGKDSTIAWIGETGFIDQKRRDGEVEVEKDARIVPADDLDIIILMMELPPMEELRWLWND